MSFIMYYLTINYFNKRWKATFKIRENKLEIFSFGSTQDPQPNDQLIDLKILFIHHHCRRNRLQELCSLEPGVVWKLEWFQSCESR